MNVFLDEIIRQNDSDSEGNETYREYIVKSEKEFNKDPADIDNMSEDELLEYLQEFDLMWDRIEG